MSAWEEPFVGPVAESPLSIRGDQLYAEYPEADGYGFPPGWRLSEWVVNFEETPFYEVYQEHVKKGMELTILVSDYHAMRGTGKTTLSVKLARAFDRTDDGLTPDKATNSAEEFIDAYVREEQGSGLVFDEAESGINARDAMTTVNKELNEKVSMGRVGEKYGVWNMPDIGQIDKEVRKLAHYWVLVQRRGRARVYKLGNNPFEDQTWTKPICDIEWSALAANDPVKASLDDDKHGKLHGEGEDFIPRPEHEEALEKKEREARKEARNEFIREAAETNLLNQSDIADIVGLDPSSISRILSQEGATA